MQSLLSVLPSSATMQIQPALVVGVGAFGSDVCRMLEERRRVRWRFDPGAQRVEEPLVRIVDLTSSDDLLPLTAAPDSLDRKAIRDDLNARSDVICAYLRTELQIAMATQGQPYAAWVNPAVYIVLATSEMYGSVALLTLAGALRSSLMDINDLRLVGLAMIGHFEDTVDQSRLAEAISFVALEEHSALMQPTALTNGATTTQQTWQGLYDVLYLIDQVKANNTTLHPMITYALPETVSHVVNFLEANLLSPLPQVLDQVIVYDYAGMQHNVATLIASFGSAALTVPIEALWNRLQMQTIGRLMETRLGQLDPGFTLHIQGQARTLATSAANNSRQLLARRLGEHFESERKTQVDWLGVDLSYNEWQVPVIVRLQPHLLRYPLKSISKASVTQLDRDVEDATMRAARSVEQVIRNALADAHTSSLTAFRSAASSRLAADDVGLAAAVTFLRAACDSVRGEADRVNEWHATQSRRHQSLLRRMGGWASAFAQRYWADQRLHSLVAVTPYFSSLALRMLVLGILLYQFYFDGFLQDVTFWPFAALDRARLETGLVLVLAGLALILSLAPLIVLRFVLHQRRRSHSKQARAEIEHVLQTAHRRYITETAGVLQSDLALLERHLESVKHRAAALQQRARTSSMPEHLLYLDRPVINVQQLMDEQMVRITPESFGPLLQQPFWWQGSVSGPLGPSALTPLDTIHLWVAAAVDPVLNSLLNVRTLESFFAEHVSTSFVQSVFESATPWLYVPAQGVNGSGPAQPSEVSYASIVTTSSGEHSALSRTLDIPGNTQFIAGVDCYRTIVLRYIFGVQPASLARYAHLRSSFQALPDAQQSMLVDSAPPPQASTAKAGVAPANPNGESLARTSGSPLSSDDVIQLIKFLDGIFAASQQNRSGSMAEEVLRRTIADAKQPLTALGIVTITPQRRDPFDVHVHDATVAVPTSDQPPDTIVRVMREGYIVPKHLLSSARDGFLLDAKLDTWVRPAQVQVSTMATQNPDS